MSHDNVITVIIEKPFPNVLYNTNLYEKRHLFPIKRIIPHKVWKTNFFVNTHIDNHDNQNILIPQELDDSLPYILDEKQLTAV